MAEFSDKARFELAYCLRETDKAILVDIDGDQHWVPKSVVDDDSEVWEEGQEGELVIAGWFADKENIR